MKELWRCWDRQEVYSSFLWRLLMKYIKRLKRPLALFMAVVLMIMTVHITGIADDLINLNPYRVVFRGKSLNAFGKTHRDMNIYQVGDQPGALPALCIQEGHKIPDGSPALYEKYNVEPGKAVPVIGPFDRYLAMVLAYEWLISDNYYIPARYGVVQVYYWGCMQGYEHNWGLQEQAMRKLQVAMDGDPMVMTYYEEMKDHISDGEAEYKGSDSTSLPAWSGSQQQMILKDGHYELTLDISSCQQLRDTTWSFPDSGWSYEVSPDGNSITFQYNGSTDPQGTITSAELQGMEARYYAYIFTPAASENLQKQLGWLNFERPMVSACFKVNSYMPGPPTEGELELFRHSETFNSNYNIDLEKYCAETDQPLEGTTFNVWEDFDFSQVNEGGYTEGNPDKMTGQVYLNRMSPEPESDHICDTITTDINGQAVHSDTRYYEYSKTYCMGHPAPEWIECDHEEDEDCSCDEENARLRQQWMAEQELCAATCDFHVQNHDEDNHQQDTAAMEAMLADRDETYENFINLEYSYHLQEKTARTGYILHGKHKDDPDIETVILSSAQAGGSVRTGDHRTTAIVGRILDPIYTVITRQDGLSTYTYPLPDSQEHKLEEQRSIIRVLKEKESRKAEENPSERPEESVDADTEDADTEDADMEDVVADNVDTDDQENSSESGSHNGDGSENGDHGGNDPDDMDQGKGVPENGSQEENDSGDEDHIDSGTEDGGDADDSRFESIDHVTPVAAIISCEKPMLLASIATGSNADPAKDDAEDKTCMEDQAHMREQENVKEYEEYEYVRNPIDSSYEIDISLSQTGGQPQDSGNAVTRFLRSLLRHDSGQESVTAALPGFMDDDLDPMDTSGYGSPDTILYTFKVWDHRTEGRIHINKRDLELYQGDQDGSYGQTQGDGTLEGAVYGLFAAQDLIHPDGKSGVVYNQNDLVAVAATDQQGDASFLVYTEKPGTCVDHDGNIKSPDGMTGPDNLYDGDSITSSGQGFGAITYPDYAAANGDQWIGRPLMMGNYYIMELSRSEGYELSVKGMSLTESNRTQDGKSLVREAGNASIKGGLSDYNSMDADGSWNDFMVESYKTENGYDITVNGYPQGTEFYEIQTGTETRTFKTLLGSSLQPKTDETGNPVYQTAKGGEYKIDSNGNPITRTETATESSPDQRIPYGETLPYRFRTAPYPNGSAAPEDISKWGQAIIEDYLAEQVNGMLAQIGYKPIWDQSPWTEIQLTGTSNSQAATQIMDWFTAHNFFDCGTVDSIYLKDGNYYARLLYDYSAVNDGYPAVYDPVNQKLYVHKTADVEGGSSASVGYWIAYRKGEYRLGSRTVSVKEKKAIIGALAYGGDIESHIETMYQPVYERYQPGEILLDKDGNPIIVLERVYEYEDRTETYDVDVLKPIGAVYDADTGVYTIHVDNTVDWKDGAEAVNTTFRAVTPKKSINYEGVEMPYNQYLTDMAGAGVSVCAAIPPLDPGSYIRFQTLAYPGQNQPVQDGSTGTKPVQVLQRVIKQPIKVTKDISQTSYDGVNTYGFLHNDPLTALLGLFHGGGGDGTGGAKILNQFKFKAYLKSNLEQIFVNESGDIISKDIGTDNFTGDVQKIYLPPGDGGGRRLLETKADGSYDYTKFFDAMYGADRKSGGIYPREVLRQFAIDYYDVAGYKAQVLAATPGLNSDAAYDKALERAEEEAASYLDLFVGLDRRLAIAWDKDKDGGADGDQTTLQCNTKNGKDDYYNDSIMLPYGTYVIAEQTPWDIGKELANRHFNKDYPKEVTLPFVPDISTDPNTGETDVNYQIGSPYYRYNSKDTPEDLIRKYNIRFNEENHIIRANGQDGDFQVYKYGLDKDIRPGHSLTSWPPYEAEYMDGRNGTVKGYYYGYTSQSEDSIIMDNVIYYSYETDSGQTEVRDHVPVMTGMQTAVEGKFASMLVPWTVLAPATDRINPDTGNVETLIPSGSGADFNFVAFAQEDFEDAYYSSRLRIEKLDAETGDNIIHDGALFKLYAAKRDVEKNGINAVRGTGDVLFGEAVDWEGNPVADADGNKILYPRVGKDHTGADDLPIHLDREGIPMYDSSQLIRQEDQDGNETGIFKAYSTIREVVIDGQVQKVPVGYIETYKPLGAGAYVLVEIQAPEGYARSRSVAIEVYADDVVYYKDRRNQDGTTNGWEPQTAARYQYAIPVAGEMNKFQTGIVSQIEVQDYPSRMEIHKVEDGDSMVGNQNILQKIDAQGRTEQSGGFDGAMMGNITVNDTGDRLTYMVHGRKEKLEERGDVRDITYHPETKDWYGHVTKPYDQFSEHIIEGTEKTLKAMSGVKLLYELDGTFTGKGIRFDIPVSGAGLSLYKAVEIEKTGEHVYKGVTPVWKDGKVAGIKDRNTGFHKEIRVTGQDSGPAAQDVWDAVLVDNEPVDLYYYDLDMTDTREETSTGELLVLDKRGNELCYADSQTGMAYVYDDYGRILAYTADGEGNKELVKSIQVLDHGNGQTIYEGTVSADDENGLPVYYTGGNVVTKDETWITDNSTDPHGNPESSGAVHTITRLPFGAYILQEEAVPYGQGYIQSRHLGLVLHDTDEVQKYFMQNHFTKTAFAKIDVRTQKEIQGASMTLYRAELDSQGSPMEENGLYRKGDMYASWISGCQYDDDGNLKLDPQGQPIPTTEPHWIDHIPIGFYVLEETICPYEQGYVQSASVNVEVKETGDVQSFEMEDDFTAIDIRKYDTLNGDMIYKDSQAWLTLYRARLDHKGYPVVENGIPRYDEAGRIFTFRAATYKDGQDVAATGRVVPDAGGNNPIMKYDYDFREIPNTYQGRFYYTEDGTTRLEYLPVGSYVLVESGNPKGYATADPVLITVEDKGHLVEVQKTGIGDKPLELEVSKVHITGGKEVNGARMSIYPVDSHGKPSEHPLVIHQPISEGRYQDIRAEWISGLDGRYTKEEETDGKIPAGFRAGDLKPHLIKYIPEGDYILREGTTPYGFLQSVDIPFTIEDTQVTQKVEMTDEIPEGIIRITKSDTDHPEQKLQGVEFQLVNQTTDRVCEEVVTDGQGQAQFKPQPIGYMDQNGDFKPYTYVCRETKAAEGHMMTLKPFEFQFEYQNELTDLIIIDYNPTNDSNRIITDKLLGDTDEMLEGVTLRVERKSARGGWEKVEEWVTGKQGHTIRNLAAGQYRLIEVRPAEGFRLLADPIEFTMKDGMKEIPHLMMRNYTSIIDIQKTVSGKDTLLAGARLQLIRKDTGKVIREWTSESEKGQRFYGLEPGIYIIHELWAPSGYESAKDKEIAVEDNGGEVYTGQGQELHNTVQVFCFENEAESSSGGGGGDKPKPETEYIIFKKKDISGNPVKGAEFTFYDQTGHVIGTSVSHENGTFRIRKPENGTYTFRETKAPAGYAENPDLFQFTVSGSHIIRGAYEVMDQELEVIITKLDGDTGLPLSGARLRIDEAESGLHPYEGITGTDGALLYRPPMPGRYVIHEVEAPPGYETTDTVSEFSVGEKGQISGDTSIYNWKEKLPARKIGKITAIYKVRNRFGKGTYHFGSGPEERVRTGDDMPVYGAIAMMVLCMAAFAACVIKKRKETWSLRKKVMTAMLIAISVVLAAAFDVFAAETDNLPASDQDALSVSGQDTLSVSGQDTMSVSGQILYSAMEAAEPVPQAAWITAKDNVTGKERKVLLPLIDYQFYDKRWEGGFEMDVTISDYGSDSYELGGRMIEAEAFDFGKIDGKEEWEFSANSWEEELLAQAGLDKEYYRIDQVKWKGNAYETDGILSRDLRASGRKLVADCRAVYGGEVNRSVFNSDAVRDHMEQLETVGADQGIGGHAQEEVSYKGWIIVGVVLLGSAVWLGLVAAHGSFKINDRMGLAAPVFLAGAVFSLVCLVKLGMAYAGSRQAYETVREIAYLQEEGERSAGETVSGEMSTDVLQAGEPPASEPSASAPPASELSVGESGINEPGLLAMNPEYKFWLSIPGTGIKYPVAQHEDNQFYLNHGFNQEECISGCVFADSSAIPLAADNTILYGHNMKDGSMFAGLKKYLDESYLREHPVIRIFHKGSWMECPIFSCQIRHENDAGAYRKDLMREEMLPYLMKMSQASLYDTGIIPQGNETLLTLSTCYRKNQRLIIQALVAAPKGDGEEKKQNLYILHKE